jgi:hypothetical protein
MQRNFGNLGAVTDVTFRFEAFVVMIRLNRSAKLGTQLGEQMDRRKERRLNLELPVRIWGVDRLGRPFAELVRIRNVSNGGAVLINVRSKIQPGEVLDVQHGASRSQFRIVWMGPSGEAGIQALEMEAPIFDMGIGMGMGTIGLPKFFDLVGTG